MYRKLEADRGSRLLVYVTGDRLGLETKVSPEVADFFVHHLDLFGDPPKISLLLYTRGGDTLAAWSLANLLRSFCKDLEVIVPSKAWSAGTLLCLGASSIIMTKQATLGPIDPSVTTALNPDVPGVPQAKVPVSVENINGFVEFARGVLGDGHSLEQSFLALAASVHPLVLGTAFRARSQIRMLASKLMEQSNLPGDRETILKFLCSESGSHDYTINRREAQSLGLPVIKPTQEQYGLIWNAFESIRDEMKLTEPLNPLVELGAESAFPYDYPRAIIESSSGGSHAFRSRGIFQKQTIPVGELGITQTAVQDSRTFEGWEHAG